MPTQRQIEANRLNAQKSTGPRTPEGKAMSSQNVLKSGLDADSQFVYGESREEFAKLQQEYEERFRPATPEERFFMDTLVRDEWMLRRLHRAEAHLWEHNITHDAVSNGTPLGAAFERVSPVFMRLQRRLTLCERSYREALAELDRLQARRKPSQIPESTRHCPKLASFLTEDVPSAPLPIGSLPIFPPPSQAPARDILISLPGSPE